MTVGTGFAPYTIPAEAVSVTVDATSTVSTGGTLDWHGRASVRRRADGVLVLCYRRGSAHDVNDGGLYIRFSDDDGATWTAENTTLGGGAVSGFPMNPSTVSAGQDAGEPQLYVAPSGDLLLHMWRIDYSVSMGGTYQSRSTDGGESWSTSEAITFGNLGTYLGSPIPSTSVFSTDDDFVVGGIIYAGARMYVVDASGDPSVSILIKSEDDGATWSRVSTIQGSTEGGTGGQEVGLGYTGGQRIVAMLRDNPHTHSYQRISTDMGATWGSLTDVTSTAGIAGRQRVYTRAQLRGGAAWWTDPILLMVGFVHQTSGSSSDRRNCVWVSRDSGATWSAPAYIDSTTDDAGYGDIFYDAGNDQFVVVSYAGTFAAADLKQYRLTIAGV